MLSATTKLMIAFAGLMVLSQVGCKNPGMIERGTEGCWVQVWSRPHFKRKTVKLLGPTEFKNLHWVPNHDWPENIASIEVGPKAWVEAYTEENFKGAVRRAAPNTRNGHLDETGFEDVIQSMRIYDAAPANWFADLPADVP